MRKRGVGSAHCSPRGSHEIGRVSQPVGLKEEHYIESRIFVQANVANFRKIVQELTGSRPTSPLSPLPQSQVDSGASTGSSVSSGSLPIPLQQGKVGDTSTVKTPDIETIASLRPLKGPGSERKSTTKLLERRQHAKKLSHLMGPHILKRPTSPALSPVSPLMTGFDIFAERGQVSSPLGSEITSLSPVGSLKQSSPFEFGQRAVSSSPDFDLNGGVLSLEQRGQPSPREPSLLPLFPMHSPTLLSL
jgi:hypothetical protein